VAGLTTQDVGVIYGTLGDCFNRWRVFGIAISKDGWVKWMLPMFFSHALTNYWFCVAFSFHPSSVYYANILSAV
jgi:hypothetical protein